MPNETLYCFEAISGITVRLVTGLNIGHLLMLRKLRHFAFPRWIGQIITELANCAAILTHTFTYRPLWAFNYPIVSTSHSGYMFLFFMFSFRFATHLVPP
jgi:hypothetical protein